MYNRLQKYLNDQNILYDKQFEFQTGYSTKHAIAQWVDQIYEVFEKNECILGMLIDFPKAFDTADHSFLLRKLEMYGISQWYCSIYKWAWFRQMKFKFICLE